MKTKNLIVISFLILALGCKQKNETPVTDTGTKDEITHKEEKKDEKTDVIFQDITELEKYKGFKQLSGQVLSGTDKVLLYLEKDNLKVLVLEKMIKNNTPKPDYSILDEVRYVSQDPGQSVVLTPCEMTEGADTKVIFSLVADEDVKYFNTILKTWWIDLDKDKFKEIDSKQVKCLNEWFGYEG